MKGDSIVHAFENGLAQKFEEYGIAPRDLELFQGTKIWLAYRAALLQLIMNLRDELETMGPNTQEGFRLEAIAFTQGEIFSLRTVLELPERLAISGEAEGA